METLLDWERLASVPFVLTVKPIDGPPQLVRNLIPNQIMEIPLALQLCWISQDVLCLQSKTFQKISIALTLLEPSISIKDDSYHRLIFKSVSGTLLKAEPSSMNSAESRRDDRRPGRQRKRKRKKHGWWKRRRIDWGQIRNGEGGGLRRWAWSPAH